MTAVLRRTFLTLRLAVLALFVAACGGGVETGGTGAIGAYVEGPISGFGSIIVGGVRIDDSSARVEDDDGSLLDRDRLRLGQRVEVEGSAIVDDGSGGRTATATRVRVAVELLGPVTAVGPLGGTVEVLGQLVRVNAATVVDGVAGGTASLAPGDVVEVSGFVEPGLLLDRYVATRIEKRSGSAPAAYRVRGVVRALDAAARTLRVGTQTFDLSTTGVPAGLADGQLVRMVVATSAVAGRWPVTRIVAEQRRVERDEAEVEGAITALTSTARFSVNGIPVDASAAAFPDGSAGVVLGARVKVRGRASAGELVASSVELRSDDDAFNDGIDLRDAIADLNTGAQTFSVRGVTVFYGTTPPPRYENGDASTLANGTRVRVRATLSPDRTRVIATRIEFL